MVRALVRLCTCGLLGVWLGTVAGCSEDPASTSRRGAAGATAAAGASGASGAPALGGNAAPVALCPADNLTQECSCDDGTSGRQICIETRGWGPCDCGQLAAMENVDVDLRSGPTDPPANSNVGVTFDDYVMPRSTADCQPGRYEGTFQCTYEGGLTPTPFEASGVVSFALERSTNAEVLEIRDGLLDGWGGAFFFAYLNGDLSCLTGEFSGTASEGFYNPLLKGCSGMAMDMPGTNCVVTDPNDPNYVPWTVNLEGNYAGSLDTSTDTIDGTWALMPLDIGGTCDGTFTVTLQP